MASRTAEYAPSQPRTRSAESSLDSFAAVRKWTFPVAKLHLVSLWLKWRETFRWDSANESITSFSRRRSIEIMYWKASNWRLEQNQAHKQKKFSNRGENTYSGSKTLNVSTPGNCFEGALPGETESLFFTTQRKRKGFQTDLYALSKVRLVAKATLRSSLQKFHATWKTHSCH